MEKLGSQMLEFIIGVDIVPIIRAVVVLAMGWLAVRLARRLIRAVEARLGPQGSMLLRRGVPGMMWVLILMAVLNELGFDLKVLLGAAGVLTVAIGFASQTAASNLISGLFLLVERPFVVGNTIEVDGVTGEVVSVDLLSVKLRTFDNLYVRVPSESLIKGRITNLTHFEIRRFDLKVRVDYREDLDRVRKLLIASAARMPLCLDEPPPLVIFLAFGPDGVELQFSVWASRERYADMKNSLPIEVKRDLDAAGIRMGTGERNLSIAAGAVLPVQLVGEEREEG